MNTRTRGFVMERSKFTAALLKTAAAVVAVEALAGLRSAGAATPSAAMPEEVTAGGPAVIALDNEGVVETIYGEARGSPAEQDSYLSWNSVWSQHRRRKPVRA